MDKEINGLVLRQIPYGENNAMVTILTVEGIKGFYARGILNITSKNASSCLLYAYSSFLLTSKNESLSLKKAEVISSNYFLYSSIEKMASISLISEIILKVVDEEDGRLYEVFLAYLDGLKNNFDTLTLTTIFLFQIVKYSGYELTLDRCVICGETKNIVSLDYSKGGFICGKCNHLIREDLTYLKVMRYLNFLNIDDFQKHVFPSSLSLRIIDELLNYLSNSFSVTKWNSKGLFFDTFK